ncbi:hypothetical protein BVRB_3g060100 [Beta vulgaris subsp. vulgaris]|nr:hypothetical protein BVRB_3g060100 [Beta vulgaris subsp. vulgaris]
MIVNEGVINGKNRVSHSSSLARPAVHTGKVNIQALRVEKFKKHGHFLQSRKQNKKK